MLKAHSRLSGNISMRRLDAESLSGHLLKADSVFAFPAAHRAELFPDEMFADLFLTGRGRPSVPADVMAAVTAVAMWTLITSDGSRLANISS